MEGIKLSSLNEVLGKLSSAIRSFVKDISDLSEENKNVSLTEIRELRNFAKDKIDEGKDPVENARIINLLNVFVEDKNFIELTKEDAEEWVSFLETIESSISKGDIKLNSKEEKELKDIKELTEQIKGLIRK
jgi:superfamily I DNA/RNA helicase